MTSEVSTVVGIVGAALGGAAIGLEREWSGHATGPAAHFAGIRTFTLLGGLGGLSGWLWLGNYELLAVALLGGGAGIVVAAYVAASRRQIDGTTEVAALVTLAAGTLAGTGNLAIASAVVAITVVILAEKSRLHTMVARIADAELQAATRFAVMAVVILPLLPSGPYGPFGGVRPRELWLLVLLFSGLNFVGYITYRAVGPRRGYLFAGLIGGLISSTSVTLLFSRTSRTSRGSAAPLAFGVMAACTVMFLRMGVATAVLHWPLAPALAPYLVAPFLAGALMTTIGMRRQREESHTTEHPDNPLGFWNAVQMAGLFQGVLFLVFAVRELWGSIGLLVSGAVLGLSDVDALTISMTRSTATGTPLAIGAQALAIGALTNTILKLGLAAALGHTRFRRIAVPGLAVLAAASIASIAILR
jgi:uncharacterized membrane protein (DUF4010 family)